ncbi:MAG: hypothetical protein WC444_07235 [Candidatus Paceibacterota bacterium]
MENKELLEKAVIKVKQKHIPVMEGADSSFAPSEEFVHIYDMLDVWDKDRQDEDIKGKTKYIYEALKTQGNPRDLIIPIITKLGVSLHNEKRIDRIYKYIRLQEQSAKLLQQYTNNQKELNALSDYR